MTDAPTVLDFDRLFTLPACGPDAYGPWMPPMLRWMRAGRPGYPFAWPGGPLPGTIGYKPGEQLSLPLGEAA